MSNSVTLNAIYCELKLLKKDMELVKCALAPEEKISAMELSEIKRIRKEMEAGKEKGLGGIFGK